jgi:hypothetical protein
MRAPSCRQWLVLNAKEVAGAPCCLFRHHIPVLRCEACWCVSDSARGWFAFIAKDPEDGEGLRSRPTARLAQSAS